ncbi:MAG: peptidoglycan editing factor PgeF [Lachnospiraceae bacterium]|nr:peptidoglycan editing factor PgeF [Lachnospiraceae bacterium]
MIKRTKNNVTYMAFELFEKAGIKHGFSTRLGGVSEGVFSSLNLGFNRGDSDENVRENFRRMTDALGINYENMCFSKQTHTTNVVIVDKSSAGNGIVTLNAFNDVDGLITKEKDLPLVTFYADCVPLFFYDPVREVVALSHSGWRGTVGKIGKVTIETMKDNFGTRPEDVLCGIGPSICKDCYEVSADVAEEFRNSFGEEAEKLLRPSLFSPDDGNKYMLDLWTACKMALLEAGVTEEHIEVTDYCTRCNSELFYSHRVMGTDRGSQAAFISL